MRRTANFDRWRPGTGPDHCISGSPTDLISRNGTTHEDKACLPPIIYGSMNLKYSLPAVLRQRCHVVWKPRPECHRFAWRERTTKIKNHDHQPVRSSPMSRIITSPFLVGVLLWTALFFIGPSPLQNIPQAKAEPLLCLSTHQPSPTPYVDVARARCAGSAAAGATNSSSQIFAQNCPLCCQFPTNPGCTNQRPNCSGCR